LSEPVTIADKPLDATTCFAESLRVWTESGMEAERARTLRAWASYEQERGDSAHGRGLWEEAREIFTRLGMRLEAERMAQAPLE
jgi:hypothetical protein